LIDSRTILQARGRLSEVRSTASSRQRHLSCGLFGPLKSCCELSPHESAARSSRDHRSFLFRAGDASCSAHEKGPGSRRGLFS
jgi:hypothetical protein